MSEIVPISIRLYLREHPYILSFLITLCLSLLLASHNTQLIVLAIIAFGVLTLKLIVDSYFQRAIKRLIAVKEAVDISSEIQKVENQLLCECVRVVEHKILRLEQRTTRLLTTPPPQHAYRAAEQSSPATVRMVAPRVHRDRNFDVVVHRLLNSANHTQSR